MPPPAPGFGDASRDGLIAPLLGDLKGDLNSDLTGEGLGEGGALAAAKEQRMDPLARARRRAAFTPAGRADPEDGDLSRIA